MAVRRQLCWPSSQTAEPLLVGTRSVPGGTYSVNPSHWAFHRLLPRPSATNPFRLMPYRRIRDVSDAARGSCPQVYLVVLQLSKVLLLREVREKGLLYGFPCSRLRAAKSAAILKRTQGSAPHSERQHPRRTQVRRTESRRLRGQ